MRALKGQVMLAGCLLGALGQGSMANAGENVGDGREAAREKHVDRLKAAARAGEDEEVRRVIKDLASLSPPVAATEASTAADFLIGRGQWDLAWFLLEDLPQAQPGLGHQLFKHESDAAHGDPARLARLEVWFKHRAEAHAPYWVGEQRLFLEGMGAGGRLYEEMETHIKEHPQDLELVRVYLDELRSTTEKRPLKWLPSVVQPRLAYDQLLVAQWLGPDRPEEALVYLERAPGDLTPEDRERILTFVRRSWAMPAPANVDADKLYRQWRRKLLAECYQRTGQLEKAQSVLVELNQEEGGGGVSSFALSQQAGEIQAHTQLKTLEQGILKAEPENKESHGYWRGRADYYRGRGDVKQERDALLKALKLTQLRVLPKDHDVFVRSMVMWDYARFLMRKEGDKAALAFLWKEYDAVDHPDHRQRILAGILNDLERDNTGHLKCDDKRLWSFLEARPSWSHLEERLLWRMARNASAAQLPAFWRRAEAAAKKGPERSYTVGWVMNRMRDPARSIPLLQQACATTEESRRRSACFTLFESYLDTGNWRGAEATWPQAMYQLTEDEKPDWLGRVAVAAAKGGETGEALRLWQMKDALDFAALGHLAAIKPCVARGEFVSYYQRMQRERPTSSVPAAALAILGQD